jgi:hypothetical protein
MTVYEYVLTGVVKTLSVITLIYTRGRGNRRLDLVGIKEEIPFRMKIKENKKEKEKKNNAKQKGKMNAKRKSKRNE